MAAHPRHPVIDGKKRCTQCGDIKPVEDFYERTGRSAHSAACKACSRTRANERYQTLSAEDRREWNRRAYESSGAAYYQEHSERIAERHRGWAAANRDKARGYSRKWREANPEKRAAYFRGVKYQLAPESWQSLLAFQGGCCAICGTDDPGSRWWHTDHDHDHCTSKRACGQCVRGLLCHTCNIRLGHVEKWLALGLCEPTRELAAYVANPPWRRLLISVASASILLGGRAA